MVTICKTLGAGGHNYVVKALTIVLIYLGDIVLVRGKINIHGLDI